MEKPLFEEISEKEVIGLLDDGKDPEGLFFSKALVVFVDVVFLLVVICSLCVVFEMLDLTKQGLQMPSASAIATILGGALTITGGASITAHVWYYKKTQAGHTAKTQAEVYMTVADKEVECKQALMQTQHDLKLSDAEASKANIQRVDSMTSGAYNALDSNLKNTMSDATAQIKREGA